MMAVHQMFPSRLREGLGEGTITACGQTLPPAPSRKREGER
jgi:hypothetical protein